MDVLDLGGTHSFWQRLPVTPRHVTAVNVAISGVGEPDWFENVEGDACELPESVRSRRYDLVFSNSTIGRVGDADRRRRFADVVYEMADRHWIQTPNRAFPLEPHVLFPCEQYLPRTSRAIVRRYWPMVHSNASTMERAYRSADGTELVGRAEFERIIPTSRIEDERVSSLLPAKSLIAISG